jgi:glycosyltransferase involved in cell wall biosynthesis
MSFQEPLVSVVTPCYNAARFIEETIRSVQEQDYAHIEHIVVDGASTDGTVEILRRHPHLTLVSEPDQGQSNALNKGFNLAHGAIVGWLNADDVYSPGAVATAVSYLQAHPDVGVVYGDCAIIDEEGRVTGRFPAGQFELAEEVLENRVAQPSTFLRCSALQASGGVDESLHYVMDYDLWLRLAAKGVKFAYIPYLFAKFRMCAGTKTVSQAERFWPEVVESYDRFFDSVALPEGVRALKHTARDRALWRAGLAYFAAGITSSGRHFCRLAVESGQLLETEPEWAVDTLLRQALESSSGTGEMYALNILRSLDLPKKYDWFTARLAPARIYEALAFKHYREREMADVRRFAAKSISVDVTRLRNLGLVSIFAESLLGASVTNAARRLARIMK